MPPPLQVFNCYFAMMFARDGDQTLYRSIQKLLPAVLLFLRAYFPQLAVTVAVLKFGWIHLITIAVFCLGVRSHTFFSIDSQLPSWKSIWINFPQITVTVTVMKCFELYTVKVQIVL